MTGTSDQPSDPTKTPIENSASIGGPVIPLAVWLAIQLAAICLSALQFRWTSRFPQPAEQWALHVLMAAQIAGSVLLFPVLLTDWRRLIIAIAIAWPLLLLASILSEASTIPTLRAGAYVTAWLATLWLWRTALRSPRLQMLGIAVLSTIVLAGPLLRYLGDEFGTRRVPLIGPIETGFGMIDGPEPRDMLVPGAIALIGLTLSLLRRHPGYRNRGKIHTIT